MQKPTTLLKGTASNPLSLSYFIVFSLAMSFGVCLRFFAYAFAAANISHNVSPLKI